MSIAGAEDFIAAHTVLDRAALVPEISLYLATEITPIWQASESWLAECNLPPPYWAFAWPGSQALARHVLDHPELVYGRRVLDFAAGCGLAAIACAMAGAACVSAAEIDPMAIAAIRMNARRNGVVVEAVSGDLTADFGEKAPWDVVLCGDVCYEAPMTRRIMPWLSRVADTAEVWIADPGRAYLPASGLLCFAEYAVPTSLELENRAVCDVRLLRLSRPVSGTS